MKITFFYEFFIYFFIFLYFKSALGLNKFKYIYFSIHYGWSQWADLPQTEDCVEYLFVRRGILLLHDIRPKLLFQYGVYKEKLYFFGQIWNSVLEFQY